MANLLKHGKEKFLKYNDKSVMFKHNKHFGQVKLLLSEIDIIDGVNDEMKPKIKNILYIGAAPGDHIVYMSKIYPKINFILYDLRDAYNKELENCDNVDLHVKYFDDEDAEKYTKMKNLLFVSDIRRDMKGMTEEQRNKITVEDMALQERAYEIIKPDYALLKFKLPWDDKKTSYLKGDIYLQIFPKVSSVETRLFVIKEKHKGKKKYDNRRYEEELFYYNTKIRPKGSDYKMAAAVIERHGHDKEIFKLLSHYLSKKDILKIKKYMD